MQPASGSTSQVALPPRAPAESVKPVDPYARLAFEAASQAQILRAHQRDGSHVQRLIELVSELIRSIHGTRWLALRQPVVDFLVKAVYLTLTLGRAAQTLGEEYTDITPHVQGRSKASRIRRIFGVLFLIAPSLLTLSVSQDLGQGDTIWSKTRARLFRIMETPWGQSLPELHLIAFLYGGRFLEFGRRLAGLRYISAAAPQSRKRSSYEPLAALLVIPLLVRLWKARQPRLDVQDMVTDLTKPGPRALSTGADDPNTYLNQEAAETSDRQCTLCLEPRGTGEGSGGTVAVTECGHVFCWGCLGGLDKPECPLCRQSLRMERLIAAYNL